MPVLVWDGEVHIESNDILTLLDAAFPDPYLIPVGQEAEIAMLLQQEDDLHLDLRSLSFRFVMNRTTSNKTPEMLARYDDGSGTDNGAPDHARPAPEIEFYQRHASDGIPDEKVRVLAERFRTAFDDFESRLASTPFLLRQGITVIDIAWYVYISRLQFAGYPLARRHPRVHAWWERLSADDRFSLEVQPPPPLRESIAKNHAEWVRIGTTFADVTGL